METKICPRCGEEKEVNGNNFAKMKKGKYGYASACKICINEKERRCREENREKALEKEKRYREENREKLLEKERRCREELTDAYIRSRLREKFKLKQNAITQEMIDLKRAQLKMHRALKKLKKEIKDGAF